MIEPSIVASEGGSNLERGRLDSMYFADEVREYDEKDKDDIRKTEQKNVENRYGKNIRGEYKLSKWVVSGTIVIGIFLIPGQLFLQGVMKPIEDPMIAGLQ